MSPTITEQKTNRAEDPVHDAAVFTPDTLPDSDAGRLAARIAGVLDEHSAQDLIMIDVMGKSSVADIMMVASGRSNRHVSALADYVRRDLKEMGHTDIPMEGADAADWVLVDAGDVILHIFRPEVRVFYNLEKIWSVPLPDSLRGVSEARIEDD